MRGGADIVVGTPGRVCDLMATGELKLNEVTHFVLDEADRMLDLGFIRDIRRIVAALPARRQSSLFSATMPAEVAKLAETLLRDPVRVDVAITAPARLPIEQHVHFVDTTREAGAAGQAAGRSGDVARHRVHPHQAGRRSGGGNARYRRRSGQRDPRQQEPAGAEKALEQFRSGRARVLVATDIAARGIDVTGISHVINFDLPAQPEDYVHRIGRTARAGASGVAISFCDAAEHGTLRAIERMTGTAINIAGGSPPTRQSNGRDGQPNGGQGHPGRGQQQPATQPPAPAAAWPGGLSPGGVTVRDSDRRAVS